MPATLEAIVATVDDLRDGEMREVQVGETAVLLVRVAGEYHALGAHCTHYGAPLAKGALHGERILCPWHHACFRATDGGLLEPPALDSLPRYSVRVDSGHVLVAVPGDAPASRPPPMATEAGDRRRFVIVGGGAAGQAAAEMLREQGFAGAITLLTAADQPPIDRPALSKEYLDGEVDQQALPLRGPDFYTRHAIDVQTGATVRAVDLARRTVALADGSTVRADALLLAPGGAPVRLDVPGAELPQVYTLRGAGDAEAILGALGGAKRAVVVGSSFIGMEAAAGLRKHKLEVTVVAPDAVPYARVFGDEVGRMFLALHEENGVQFRLGHTVSRIEGAERVTDVVLDSGERLHADLVVVGIGVRPATQQIEGLPLRDDGGVQVDGRLQVAEGVFAAGDVAAFPDPISGLTTRIEHWRLAEQHGRHAARAMLGEAAPFAGVPFFWTKQFGVSLRYVGHAEGWDELILWGKPAERDFISFYSKGGRVRAAAGVERDAEMAAVEELLRVGRMPAPDLLRGGALDLAALLR